MGVGAKCTSSIQTRRAEPGGVSSTPLTRIRRRYIVLIQCLVHAESSPPEKLYLCAKSCNLCAFWAGKVLRSAVHNAFRWRLNNGNGVRIRSEPCECIVFSQGNSEKQSGDRAFVSASVFHVRRRRPGAHRLQPQDGTVQSRQGNHHARSGHAVQKR